MKRHVTAIISGIIQGIGFRPFCSRLAREIGLGGSVRNTARGIRIELFGPREATGSFLERLRTDCPTLGHIQSIVVLHDEPAETGSSRSFDILESENGEENLVLIPPDIATCEDCLREMRDPDDRRYGYPLINCTNCGPRFTIITGLPYDRPMTTMSPFPLCENCESEYRDPGNRRFHAQPVACEKCGPHLALLDRGGFALAHDSGAIEACATFLAGGGIAAIKGLGGFHIACLPDDASIAELRKRKKRPHKPFALMVRDESTAGEIVRLSTSSRLLLNSPRRPIIVCPKRAGSEISGLVAPFLDSIGVMLPYTPLHHLILERIPVLVMTSANLSEAPIISDNAEAVGSLGAVADRFLVHEREIRMKIDDSVISTAGKRSILLRRGRGFVPHPLVVDQDMPQILAAGAEMKSTFSLTREKTIFISQYLGDLKQMGTAVFYEKALRHFIGLFGLNPRFLAADLHPSYLGADIARKVIGEPEDTLLVQHHHAHLAACLAENGYRDPVIGIILDGTGFGCDRTTWGGEFLVGDLRSFERSGHFRRAPLPGGDRSVLEPWRFGLSLLENTFGRGDAASIAEKLWPEMSARFGPVLSTL
ncbi:MAG: carbamoyltransferase HypF, partial [Thermovirgaceae bacterium]|nr:carbamoyltransferase HypF [Thermovirgaceae bacterium]